MARRGFTFGSNAPAFTSDRIVALDDPQPRHAFGDMPEVAELAQINVFEEANNLPMVFGPQSARIVSETPTMRILVVAQHPGSTAPISGYAVNATHDKTILMLRGAVRVHFAARDAERSVDVETGGHLVIPQGLPHTIMADSVVRLPRNERNERALMMISYTVPAYPRRLAEPSE